MDLLTPQQAAEIIGVTRVRIYQFLLDGRLAHQVISGRKLIEREDVLAFAHIERKPGNPNWRKND